MSGRFSVDGPAVVTGASRGIGRAVAETFAADGADVAVCSRDESEITAAADEISDEFPGDAIGVECDVRERESVGAFVEAAVEAFGGLDVLVNNAGASFVSSFEDISANGWQSVVDVNLTGTVNCSQAASDHLDGGSVVNVASVAGTDGAPYMSHYAASKAAVVNLTRTLAYEWAGRDVRVNCVAPGYVATPGLESQMGISADEVDRESVDRNVGVSEEIADAVRFLASDAASFVTGQTLSPRGVPPIEETPEL
ncbi:SDR family NAD(P)-dependent oxidoreductase [Haloarcula nitratireducens]|uniref:SDR family oxidoreductase n=1 Tax=Haloarcula nitratireducens TaxID=2487749 RepID=A0AAW4P7Q0_9EURY|nr:SDR family NAD(P)-dependent oxidoreductase [Halomicroarcula nitratireducens]MBX0293783.1 SDR family oxidoreductase [Halomicroarcula nitratireducens]